MPKTEILSRLNARQKNIVYMIAMGLSNRQIAVLSGTNAQGVKNRIRGIYDLVGCDTRLQLANLIAEEILEAESIEGSHP